VKLKIAGINHNDILGPQRLLQWLEDVKRNEDTLPEFVAVESDQKHFLSIKLQRPLMRKFVLKAWPDTTQEIQVLFEESLLFEVDLHTKLFPTVETLWMDQERVVHDLTMISNYAKDRMNLYRSLLQNVRLKVEIADIKVMCKVAWDICPEPKPGGTERDRKFASVILQRSQGIHNGWGIVIVGSSHASLITGTMLSRIIDGGISCGVTELTP
jgi:hypothetical protein